MKGFIAFGLLLLLSPSSSLPAAAVDGERAKYAGGTAPGVNAGTVGRIDTTSETSLIFEYAGKQLTIPYATIESFDHAEVVARHLGVLPVIVVRLLKARQRRHFFRISYRNPNGVAEVAVFEVPKTIPRPLQAVLDARAPHTDKSCRPCAQIE